MDLIVCFAKPERIGGIYNELERPVFSDILFTLPRIYVIIKNREAVIHVIKETKNIITKETCKKDLMNSAKATFFAMLFLLPLILLLAIFLVICGISVMEYIFLGILSIALAAFISFCFIFALINRFLVLNLIKKNEFSIVKDTVCRISKGELVSRNRTANVIYFTKFGRHIPSQTVFDLTSIDDEFYIVVIHTKEKEPALFFHSMMYECKELDK